MSAFPFWHPTGKKIQWASSLLPPPLALPAPLNLVIGPAFHPDHCLLGQPWVLLGFSEIKTLEDAAQLNWNTLPVLPATHRPHIHKESSSSLNKGYICGKLLQTCMNRKPFSPWALPLHLEWKPVEKANLKQKDLTFSSHLPTKGKHPQTSTPSWALVTRPPSQFFLQGLGILGSGKRGGGREAITQWLAKCGPWDERLIRVREFHTWPPLPTKSHVKRDGVWRGKRRDWAYLGKLSVLGNLSSTAQRGFQNISLPSLTLKGRGTLMTWAAFDKAAALGGAGGGEARSLSPCRLLGPAAAFSPLSSPWVLPLGRGSWAPSAADLGTHGAPLLGSLVLTLHRALSSRRDSRLPEVTGGGGESRAREGRFGATVLPGGTGDCPGLGGQRDLEAAALRGPARLQRADTQDQQHPTHLPLKRMESGAVVPEMVLINPL